jgi:arabinogalactan endo-1,4-beta-galactosidase
LSPLLEPRPRRAARRRRSPPPRLEAAGAVYRIDGVTGDPLTIFHDAGYRLVRLRLWHSPADSLDRLPAVVAFAQRVRAAGFEILLDLHYSDTWADPGRQEPPAAWVACRSGARRLGASYTGVVRVFHDAGVLPERIQLGNDRQRPAVGSGARGRGGAGGRAGQWTRLASFWLRRLRDAAPARAMP